MVEKKVGLSVLLVMLLSLAGIAYFGAGAGEKSIFLIIFSITIAFSILFFEEWFEQEE